MSQRIRITSGPWPERIGLTGVIVEPSTQQAKVYPFAGLPQGEVVVLLGNDPFADLADFGETRDPAWSCVIYRNNVESIA